MVIRDQDEVLKNIKSFASAYQKLLLEKKAIDRDIKELKENYKEEGVPVGIVTKVLNKIKAKEKMSESDRLEEDIIFEKLDADTEILQNIRELLSK